MAIPEDRKVIYSSHAVPQVSYSTANTEETTEEGTTVGQASYTRYKLDTVVGKSFGGKGTTTITPNQGTDTWTSMMHSQVFWEMLDDDTATTGNLWEDMTEPWSGELTVENGSPLRLRTIDTTDIKFLYVKNTGSNEAKLALENNEYLILIPPGAAVSMRLADSISSTDIKVDTTSGSTDLEYIIAK